MQPNSQLLSGEEDRAEKFGDCPKVSCNFRVQAGVLPLLCKSLARHSLGPTEPHNFGSDIIVDVDKVPWCHS